MLFIIIFFSARVLQKISWCGAKNLLTKSFGAFSWGQELAHGEFWGLFVRPRTCSRRVLGAFCEAKNLTTVVLYFQGWLSDLDLRDGSGGRPPSPAPQIPSQTGKCYVCYVLRVFAMSAAMSRFRFAMSFEFLLCPLPFWGVRTVRT